jgi:hypothetical protein
VSLFHSPLFLTLTLSCIEFLDHRIPSIPQSSSPPRPSFHLFFRFTSTRHTLRRSARLGTFVFDHFYLRDLVPRVTSAFHLAGKVQTNNQNRRTQQFAVTPTPTRLPAISHPPISRPAFTGTNDLDSSNQRFRESASICLVPLRKSVAVAAEPFRRAPIFNRPRIVCADVLRPPSAEWW